MRRCPLGSRLVTGKGAIQTGLSLSAVVVRLLGYCLAVGLGGPLVIGLTLVAGLL